MRITLIGHATLFVESDGCRALVDPVLFDPHQEGLLHVAPPREVILEMLPPFDLLIVSHRHLDHFDVRSLAHLPRRVEIVIADDDLVAGALGRLGFSRVRRVHDFEELTFGGTTLLVTRSENRVPEHGFVFKDASGTFWNQIDTVLSDETIERVKAWTGGVDLMFAAWQPLLENDYQSNRPLSFPLARYARMIEVVRRTMPRFVVPGSCGFAYVDMASWMNHIVFPVTRERYCEDLAAGVPPLAGRILPLDPGDTVILAGGEARRGASSPFVKRLDHGPAPREFRPSDAPRPVVDVNPDGRSVAEMERTITRELTVDLPAFVESAPAQFAAHHQWPVRHQLEVVFPEFRRRWSFVYGRGPLTASAGDDALSNLFTVITASSLAGLIDGTRGWDWAFLSGSYRTSRTLYAATPDGLAADGAAALRDPLRLRFPFDSALESVIERELATWSAVPCG